VQHFRDNIFSKELDPIPDDQDKKEGFQEIGDNQYYGNIHLSMFKSPEFSGE